VKGSVNRTIKTTKYTYEVFDCGGVPNLRISKVKNRIYDGFEFPALLQSKSGASLKTNAHKSALLRFYRHKTYKNMVLIVKILKNCIIEKL